MEIVILANWKIHILHKISIVEIANAGIFCDKTIRPESENTSYMYQILCFSELASRCDYILDFLGFRNENSIEQKCINW